MPRRTAPTPDTDETTPEAPERRTAPAARSVACRRCGAPVEFDEPDDDDIVRCTSCGAANLAPEER